MSRHVQSTIAASVVALAAFAGTASGQWSGNPAANLAIGSGPGGQETAKIASRPDGGCYVGWFDSGTGAYTMRLSRLDAAGNEMWGHNGILISNKPQMTSLVDWDLIVDDTGSAVLAFCDLRTGGDLDVVAYRIAADGSFLWGPDGVNVSSNADADYTPRLAQLTTGDIACIWGQTPNSGSGAIRMQRYDLAGNPQLAVNGVKIGGLANEKPGFCQLVAADNGSAVALWIRNIAQFTSPRHLHAQKVDPNGALLWNGGAGQVVVFNQSVPIAHDPRLLPDGSGGAFVGWHRASGNAFSCFVQHLDGTGAALLTANGFEVTVDAAFNRMDPSIALDPGTGDLVVALRKMDSNQTNRGLVAQRITPAGVRSWGATGKLLEPVDLVDEGFPRVQCVGTDSIITWFTTPTFGGVNSAIRATRLDANGLPVWAPAAIDVCSVLSPKDDPVIARGAGDSLLIAWTDERNATFDVYGERLNADGTLGTPVVPCPADLNGDGQVNGADLGLVIGGWGQPGPADLNGDGTVDGADLGMVIGTWGPCS